jgi:formamidopyrimidine-DNA glycosylase
MRRFIRKWWPKAGHAHNSFWGGGRIVQQDEDVLRPTDWKLSASRINHLQQASMMLLIRRCRQAHMVNVHVRINGKWEVFQADWLKHMEPK